MTTLYLMLGLPGAGKSTAAAAVSAVTGAVHLSSDAVRLRIFPQPQFTQTEHDTLYRTLDYLTELLLSSGVSVVYDANLNRREHRQEKYNLVKKLNAEARLLWVQVDAATAKERRVREQDRLLLPASETAEAMFDRIADIFEPPSPNESCVSLDGTAITAEYVKAQLSIT